MRQTIAILSARDRVVQQAIHQVLQPVLEPQFPSCSYAYRPGVCAHHALRAIDMQLSQGLTWIAESDIASYFDNISHRLLLQKLASVCPDRFILTLIARCLALYAVEPGTGIPQGAATSPLLSNLYLVDFDRQMSADGHELIRYGDDFVLLSPTRKDAYLALGEAEATLRRMGLSLSPDKTRVVSRAEGFVFLGYRFDLTGRRPSEEAVSRQNEKIQVPGFRRPCTARE